MIRFLYRTGNWLAVIALLILTACTQQSRPPIDTDNIQSTTESTSVPTRDDSTPTQSALEQPTPRPMTKEIAFDPFTANYAEEVDQTFQLTDAEKALLQHSGFVVSDRLAFKDFTNAYAYIYWKDLPVLITTDSILHAVHEISDNLLMATETNIIAPQLDMFLKSVRQQLREDAQRNNAPDLETVYEELDIYLSVPIELLAFDEDVYNPVRVFTNEPSPEASNDEEKNFPAGAEQYIQLAQDANSVTKMAFLGSQERFIDFTLFMPRGHYTESEMLQRYFKAMSWLAQIDFRLLSCETTPCSVDLRSLASAVLLHDTIDRATQRDMWIELDHILRMMVGQSDNMILTELSQFINDANLGSPSEVLHLSNTDSIQTLLESGEYGKQLIAGQVLYNEVADDGSGQSQSLPSSFMLFGQQFAIDAYVMSELVYDRLIVDGEKVRRPFPKPFDVMYALGNERAKAHIQDDLEQYRYTDQLAMLRGLVDGLAPDFWQSSTYNYRLAALRALNTTTTTESYPQAMRTEAWHDKMLHTQLASWAQLRHDYILYAKQSMTSGVLCEYPTGYVEPYPEFYAAIQSYAQAGHTMFSELNFDHVAEEDMSESMQYQIDHAKQIQQTAQTLFRHLDDVAQMLQAIAEKELQLLPLTPEEEAFIKDTVVIQTNDSRMCGAPPVELKGWYTQLWNEEESPALIADVHTNINQDVAELLPPGVLHIATGPVAAVIFVAETDEGATMYAGPSFTYYETIEEGLPPTRLTDVDWMERLWSDSPPTPPDWTAGFRVPRDHQLNYLHVDGTEFVIEPAETFEP